MISLARQCVRFREMLSSFIRRELRQRYVGSVLGRVWPVLQPLMVLGVYYVVFIRVLQLRISNPEWTAEIDRRLGAGASEIFPIVLLCAGLVPWLATAEYLVRVANIVLENGNLVKKMSFPSELLPVYLLGAQLVNLVVMLGIFALVVWIFTPFWSPLIWMLPIIVLLHGLFILGIGNFLAASNVFIRDVNQLTPIITNLWFFLTPIVYVRELLPEGSESWSWIFDWNPLSYLVDLYRWALVFPDDLRLTIRDGAVVPVEMSDVYRSLAIFAAIAIAVFFAGQRFFLANRHKFADEL